MLERLDDGDFGADGVVEVGELEADGAGADDASPAAAGRVIASRQVMTSCRRVDAGQGGERAPVAMMTWRGRLPCRRRHWIRRPGRGAAARCPAMVVDLVLLEQEPDALADLVGDVAAALDDRGEVERGVVDHDAEVLRVLDVVEDLGRA